MMRADVSPDPARETALSLLAQRSYSVGELVGKLLKKGFAPQAASEAAEWLLSLGYLNDEAYARERAQAYAERGYGRGRIRMELRVRALAEDLIDQILAELPASDEAIDGLIARLSAGRDLSDPRQRRRLTDALARRGFSWTEIREGLERVFDT